ncbi:MAG: hypothetical protein IT340_01260 [Chloroflexi bacterium]|nr:hypothetical protein [Chloroflexota bacterium]
MVETRGEQKTQAPLALWETDVTHPDGGVWRVRTQDLEREPLQMPAEMIKAVIGNRGQFVTTVYGPDGGQYKTTYSPNRADAEAFHSRMVERISTGQL